MNGKQKCRILKQIRQQIAQENDIALVVEECTHKGDCRGTCPRCEAEVRYLERELEKRRELQKRVALAGISAGMTLALSGCAVIEQVVDTFGQRPGTDLSGAVESDVVIEDLAGDVPETEPPEDGMEEVIITEGEVPIPEYPEILTGMVPPLNVSEAPDAESD